MMRHKPVAKTRLGLAAFLLLGTCLTGLSGPASAQVPDAQTTTADPGRISDHLRETPMLPQVSPRVEVRDMALQKVPEGAENVRLSLNSLQLDGVSVYSAEQLLPVYQDKLGQAVSLADVYG